MKMQGEVEAECIEYLRLQNEIANTKIKNTETTLPTSKLQAKELQTKEKKLLETGKKLLNLSNNLNTEMQKHPHHNQRIIDTLANVGVALSSNVAFAKSVQETKTRLLENDNESQLESILAKFSDPKNLEKIYADNLKTNDMKKNLGSFLTEFRRFRKKETQKNDPGIQRIIAISSDLQYINDHLPTTEIEGHTSLDKIALAKLVRGCLLQHKNENKLTGKNPGLDNMLIELLSEEALKKKIDKKIDNQNDTPSDLDYYKNWKKSKELSISVDVSENDYKPWGS